MTKLELVRQKEASQVSFPIAIGLHQGSTLSSYFFVLTLDELIRSIQDEVP
jgi:hypothetical protein